MQLTILSYIIMNTGEEEKGRIVENAVEYIELEAHSEVTSTSIEEWFSHYGERTAILTVETADENQPSFWVASGGGPTNLYPKS